jgi:DNA-binding FadR family transcriptional regulator
MELNLIRIQAIAARIACEQMTEADLRDLRDLRDRTGPAGGPGDTDRGGGEETHTDLRRRGIRRT